MRKGSVEYYNCRNRFLDKEHIAHTKDTKEAPISLTSLQVLPRLTLCGYDWCWTVAVTRRYRDINQHLSLLHLLLLVGPQGVETAASDLGDEETHSGKITD